MTRSTANESLQLHLSRTWIPDLSPKRADTVGEEEANACILALVWKSADSPKEEVGLPVTGRELMGLALASIACARTTAKEEAAAADLARAKH